MRGRIKIIVMLFIICLVVLWLNNRIHAEDLSFYVSKDNGFTIRFISVCFLSALFYSTITKKYRLRLFVIGFFVGFLSNIISYLIWFFFFDDYGLSFHIIACILFILIFMLINRFFPTVTGKVKKTGSLSASQDT